MRCAIISGITGQDASYLSEILLNKDYTVVGIKRRSSTKNDWRIKHLQDNPNFVVESGDITDKSSIDDIVDKWKPSEFYSLAAMSHVGTSFKQPIYTNMVNSGGVLNCLESVRKFSSYCRFYQASTSELFGRVQQIPQTEKTSHYPLSPYASAKLAAYWFVKNYRESYDMFATNGILFNHCSPRRGIEFVTRKITDAAARIKVDGGGVLELGNLEPKRDFGHARDYMYAAWLMLQQSKPDDYVISSNETHSIREVLDVAFSYLDLDWTKYVVQNPKFMRPNDVNLLLGDSSKARKELGWKPTYTFESLIKEMVDADLGRHKNG